MFSQYAYMYVKCNSIRTNMQVHDHSRSCLIAGLDCGLPAWIAGVDCWTGLMDWIVEWIVEWIVGWTAGLDCWTGLLDWIVELDCGLH